MYCPKCGKIVDEGVKFCPYCGESLVKSENKTSNTNSTNKNFTNNNINNSTTNNANKRKKDIFLKNISTERKCCYVFVILLILFIAAYVINYNTDRENVFSFHQDEFDALDIDGNEYLTFDEAKEYGNKTPESKLLELFNLFDHNKNGLLKGEEWDVFRYAVYDYEHPKVEKSKPSTSNSNSKSSSSSSQYHSNAGDDWEEVDEIRGYDSMGYPIYVSYYYTSGDTNMEPGVYRYVGNEYSGYDIEYVSSDWKHEYHGD